MVLIINTWWRLGNDSGQKNTDKHFVVSRWETSNKQLSAVLKSDPSTPTSHYTHSVSLKDSLLCSHHTFGELAEVTDTVVFLGRNSPKNALCVMFGFVAVGSMNAFALLESFIHIQIT